MTIRRGAFADWFVRCDGCHETETFPASTPFMALARRLRDLGWKIMRPYGVWRHRCPVCEQKSAAPATYFERIHA